jgi:protein subunit release factor A
MLKSTLSKALRAIVPAVEALDQHQLDALLSGKGKLVFVENEKAQKITSTKIHDAESVVGPIRERLDKCKDRDEARSVLKEIPSKETLSSLARSLQIHIVNNDRREDIENKIVEFTVGAKLRSEAIRTLNMKGSRVQSHSG